MAKINSRQKGASAERELISELRMHLGDEIAAQMKRNLEQSRKGGHDIAGLDGWAIEVKRYQSLSESDLSRFWERQVIEQALKVKSRPALAYRADYRPWRVRVPIALIRDPGGLGAGEGGMSSEWTADIGLEAFCSMIREVHCGLVLRTVQQPETMPA
jgi:Holliday junction resolvase